MNTTTSLDRNQILNPCELIHTSHSGNLSGSRIPRPGVVPLYPSHFVNTQTQPHPGIAGRHPHSLPSHHLESDYGLHSLDRRSPPSLGAQHGRSLTRTTNTSRHRTHLRLHPMNKPHWVGDFLPPMSSMASASSAQDFSIRFFIDSIDFPAGP